MKILKSILLGLALTIAFTAAKADGKPTKTDVLNIFMDASAHGKMEKFEAVLAKDLEYSIQEETVPLKLTGSKWLTFIKLIKMLSKNANAPQQPLKITTCTWWLRWK